MNPKMIQIVFSEHGTLYGLDETGDVWFAFKKEVTPIRWHPFIKNSEHREMV